MTLNKTQKVEPAWSEQAEGVDGQEMDCWGVPYNRIYLKRIPFLGIDRFVKLTTYSLISLKW
ncbi:MAG: hypothetical protein NPIRA03_33390 [Nitrospirales bacterium]|nr:MAG: hypothetical protein NPIRA03_33390 [Nitrospirales bacterium]